MSSHIEIDQKEYKVSNIRLINLIAYGLVGTTNVRINMCDSTNYSFTTNLSENMLREILITLDHTHIGIKFLNIENKDTSIKIHCESGRIILDMDKLKVSAAEKRLALLKDSGDPQQTFVAVIEYDILSISDVFDMLDRYGQLTNANTIILNNGDKIHIAKYRYFSIVIYNNKVYVIDFGVDDHVKAKKVTERIKDDFNNRVDKKGKIEEFCIR